MRVRQWRSVLIVSVTLCLFYALQVSYHLQAATTVTPEIGPLATPSGSSQQSASALYLPLVRNNSISGPAPATSNPTTPTATVDSTNTPAGVDNTPEATQTPPPNSQARVIGYFVSWSVYERNFHVADIAADKLTHVNYAFANISEEGDCILGDVYADTEKIYPKSDSEDDPPGTLHGSFNQLRLLKEANPHIKTLISVGGWNWSSKFSDVALTAESRERFARSCVDFMVRYGFDGLDIDWEYPVAGGLNGNGARPEDKQNFTLLLEALRTALDARASVDGRAYLLTIAAPAGPTLYANLELDRIHPYLDWLNVMTYDFYTGGEAVTNLNAPLYAAADDPAANAPVLNADAALRAYLEAGVPANKVVMGVPFYGRGWSGVNRTNQGLFQPSSGLPSGTWESGVFDYADLAANYVDVGYSRQWHSTAQVPWLYSADEGVMISYDDAESVSQKMDYIKRHGLGGAMIWELSADSPGGVEGADGRKIASLLTTIYAQLNLPAEATQTPLPSPATSTPASANTPTATGVSLPTASVTPTFTPVGAPSNTPASGATPASTSTNTPISTPTTGSTAAPTATPSATATPLATPPHTATPTSNSSTPDNPAATPTPTPTNTPVNTATHTPTNTPNAGVDLVINGLEVTQGIQDAANSVPLVANRATTVRVFAKVAGGAANGIQVSVAASRSGQPLGVVTATPGAISSAPVRSDAASTVNVSLPLAWTVGTINLTVTVDSESALAESNESNNSYAMALTFNEVPAFHAVLVPINYTHNGELYPAPTEDTVSDTTLELFPLSEFNVTVRAPHDFIGNLHQEMDWQTLALEMDALKMTDGAPDSTYYYAVVPVENENGRWFTSGVAGISAVGARFGAGLSGSPLTATHEFGHGFGLPHAPCGVNGSAEYPYANASIGEYGFDKQGQVKDPAQYKDIMSYCAPKWISDYTYKKIYEDQRANGQIVGQSVEDILVVRAHILDGVVTMLPTYSLLTASPPSAKPSGYTLELLNAQGQQIAQYSLRAVALEVSHLEQSPNEHEESSTLVAAAVPVPAQPVATVRILHNNSLLASQNLTDYSTWINQVQLTITPLGEQLRVAWTMTGIPVTIRFSDNGGATWLTLAVDNTGGALTLDPKLLPQDGRGLYQIIPGNSSSLVSFETLFP